MSATTLLDARGPRRLPCGALVALLAAGAFALTVHGLMADNVQAIWRGAVTPSANFERLLIVYSFLPRVAISIIAGAGLGFSGTIFQHVLRNPLAEPTTLGTSAGAALAIAAASIFAPGLLALGQAWIALAGGVAATAIVLFLAYGSSIAPLTLIMSGLVVSLLCGGASGVLVLLHTQYLSTLFIWSAGSLVQTDWNTVLSLLPCVAVAMGCTAFLLRPLSLLVLDDEGARSLGVAVSTIRLVALAFAVAVAAFVVSAVGLISFIGLAAPAVARSLGINRLNARLVWAPLLGGTMLWLTDQAVQLLQMIMPSATTGMATALIGAPVLLWLLPRSRMAALPLRAASTTEALRHPSAHAQLAVGGLLLALTVMALDLGRNAHGWHFAGWEELHEILPWRWPRVLAAIVSGSMLAVAGNLLQRLTGNYMASPEALGLSAGAAAGVIALVVLVAFPDKPIQVLAAAIGALVALVAMLAVGQGAAFSPDRLLLVGIAIGSLCSALVSFLMATDDPRLDMLLSWMSGSTYAVTKQDALVCTVVGGVLIAAVPLVHRWLAILPLGDSTSREVGLHVGRSRLVVLLFTAALTGAPTLVVGPFTFVGLMAPHIARMLGLRRPIPQLYGAAVLGALIMLVADWLGRNLMFPDQVPAGLLASFIGAPYFLWLMWRRRT